MSGDTSKFDRESTSISTSQLKLTSLVGQQVKLFSTQFPGKTLSSKVLSAGGNRILVNTSGPSDPLISLVNHQKVVVQFPYKGQEVSINARLKRSDGGRCYFEFEGRAVPLSQRRFLRVKRKCLVKLAAVSVRVQSLQQLNRLRWIESSTTDFSSGGMLLRTPSYLENGVTLLLNVDIDDDLFPPLVLGRVRYSYQDEENGFKTGVEFLVKEVTNKLLPRGVLERLPAIVLNYTVTAREKLNRKLQVMNPWTNQPDRSMA